MSEDPIGFRGKDFNLYRYVKNRSTIESDPSGLQSYPNSSACRQEAIDNYWASRNKGQGATQCEKQLKIDEWICSTKEQVEKTGSTNELEDIIDEKLTPSLINPNPKVEDVDEIIDWNTI